MTDSYNWFRPPVIVSSVVAGASPFTWTNTTTRLQIATVAGGMVTTIETNIGAGFTLTGLAAGAFTVFPGQSLRITYVTAPTINLLAP